MAIGKKNLLLLAAVIVIGLSVFGGSIAWAAEDTVSGVVYSVTGTEATITGFTPPAGFGGDLVIPASLGGAIVTGIDTEAFKNQTSLTSVTIPSGVTSIGYYAFGDCTNLISVTIPNGVTGIGDYGFCNTKLTSINIPDSVTSIGVSAFEGCASLTSVIIPNGVTIINNGTFINCSSLTSITIPNSVTSIGDYAFFRTKLTSINIPDSVTSIGVAAFHGCIGLTSITIPDSVTSMGVQVFCGCSGLTSVELSNRLTSIEHSSFTGCRSLTDITIPDSVTSIGGHAFSDCISLTDISIPDSVTSYGTYVFEGCSGLTVVSLSNNADITLHMFIGCTGLTSITIPEGVNELDEAFVNCSSLTGITIPASVTAIWEDAFVGCSGFTIYGKSGSFANQFANLYNIPFVDVNTSPVITPDRASFDRNPANQQDVTATITWNTAKSVADVRSNGITIGAGNYSASGNNLLIRKEYLAGQSMGDLVLTIEFYKGNAATLTITISDSTVGSGGSSGGGSGGSTTPSGTTVTSSGRTFSENGVTLNFPAETVESDIRVQVKQASQTAGMTLPDNSQLLSRIVDIVKDKSGNFSRPVTITLSFNKSGFNPDEYDIAICYYDENTGKWIALDNIKLNLEDGTISGEVQHFTKFAVIATPKTEKPSQPVTPQPTVNIPSDISGHWAKDSIMKLINAGVISGYPDGTFHPDKAVTRAEFTVMLMKALNRETRTGKSFTDTASHWAKDSISTAAAHGIISGYDENTFGPDDLITRAQAAVIISRAAKLEAAANELNFTDSKAISPWAQPGVAAAVKAGFITGYPDGSFRPQGNTTRAEAAVMIGKLLKDNKEVFK